MSRLTLFLIIIWMTLVVETTFGHFAPDPWRFLQPTLWLLFIYSIRSTAGKILTASVWAGLLLDFWSTLPFGIVLISTVLSVFATRSSVARWLSHRPAIASSAASIVGLAVFTFARDALGVAAGLVGANSGWVTEPSALLLQLYSLLINSAAVTVLIMGAAMIRSTVRKSFRLGDTRRYDSGRV